MAAMSGVEGRSFQLKSPTYQNVGSTPNIGAYLGLEKAAPLLYVAAALTVGWFAYQKWGR